MKKGIKIFIITILLGIFLYGCSYGKTDLNNTSSSESPALTNVNNNSPELPNTKIDLSKNPSKEVVKDSVPTQTIYPKSLIIPVLFTSQAPYANWDELHNEACEEASMIMADSFFNKKILNKEIAEQQIQDLVLWETKNGYTVDVTSQEVVEILDTYFSLQGELEYNVTPQKIIQALNKGKLVIIPAAGRELHNPNYKQPGPLYHMLVIRGYDANKKQFNTNDPGTRKGEGYRYSYDVLISAIHDWPKQGKGSNDVTEEEMRQGKKVMIVVSRD